jgi:hypothetical protein
MRVGAGGEVPPPGLGPRQTAAPTHPLQHTRRSTATAWPPGGGSQGAHRGPTRQCRPPGQAKQTRGRHPQAASRSHGTGSTRARGSRAGAGPAERACRTPSMQGGKRQGRPLVRGGYPGGTPHHWTTSQPDMHPQRSHQAPWQHLQQQPLGPGQEVRMEQSGARADLPGPLFLPHLRLHLRPSLHPAHVHPQLVVFLQPQGRCLGQLPHWSARDHCK